MGYNPEFQRSVNIGRVNNQNFVNIPIGQFKDKIQYYCELRGIEFVEQEESYTSKSSFFDNDILPVYQKENTTKYQFSGKRISRGRYKCSNGKIINADVNGALNILRKSKLVDVKILQSRGNVDVPLRIRIA